ncbi:unnamed protein product [Boreogadus saida]
MTGCGVKQTSSPLDLSPHRGTPDEDCFRYKLPPLLCDDNNNKKIQTVMRSVLRQNWRQSTDVTRKMSSAARLGPGDVSARCETVPRGRGK